MNERSYWGNIVGPALRRTPKSAFVRVESRDTRQGIPDVDYVIDGEAGKLELKCQYEGENYFVWRDAQRAFTRDWVASGGRCGILARVVINTEVFHVYYHGMDALRTLAAGRVPAHIALKHATKVWPTNILFEELIACLTSKA